MKKSYSIYIVLILFVILFSIYFVKIQLNTNLPEITLNDAISTAGAKVVSTEMYFWGKTSDARYNGFEGLKQLSASFAQQLGIMGGKDLSGSTVNNDMLQKVEISSTVDNGRMLNVRAEARKNEAFEKYISISIIANASTDPSLAELRKKVERVYKDFGIKPSTNTCITGNFDGKLDYDRLNEISRGIFQKTGAKKVEGMRDGGLISISAYSPSISDYIKVEENKVNLNLALRYNSYEDKTYIWLATPVITTEY